MYLAVVIDQPDVFQAGVGREPCVVNLRKSQRSLVAFSSIETRLGTVYDALPGIMLSLQTEPYSVVNNCIFKVRSSESGR